MNSLNNFINRNKEGKKMFSEIIPIDWYDGYTQLIGKLEEDNKWFVANLSYFDINSRIRIFTLIETDEDFANNVKERTKKLNTKINHSDWNKLLDDLKDRFNKHSGKIYLIKCADINDVTFEIVEAPFDALTYFKDVESVLSQDSESANQWLKYF